MSAAPLIIEFVGVFFLVLYFLNYYGNLRKQNIFVTLATFISWYFSFLIIFLLPLDVSSTTYRQCKKDAPTTNLTCVQPWTYVSDDVFPIIWRIIYWSSQLLTWIILPFMQSFSQSGELHLIGKIKAALIANAIYYGTYLALFGVFLIYVAIRHHIDGQQLKVIGITASNTWGLFLLVLLLGFGLVDVPRSLWYKSIPSFQLKLIYFKLAKLNHEKIDNEETLEEILSEVKQIAEKVKYNCPLWNQIDILLSRCPNEFVRTIHRNTQDYSDYVETDTSQDMPSETYLVRLHTKLIQALQNNDRTQSLFNTRVRQAIFLEDVVASELNTNHTLYDSIKLNKNFIENKMCTPKIGWLWYCLLRRWLFKLISIMLMLLSVMVIWSEMTFFNRKPVISFFAIFLQVTRHTYNYFAIELMCYTIITYLAFCAYYTIFHMRIFNYFYLAPNHMTNENSLIFCGMQLCRLTSPLCYNFLGLLHLDSHITQDKSIVETSFTSLMGNMDVISFISNGFNIYFPMLILLFCSATLFHVGRRILDFFGFQQFIENAENTHELVEDGKNLIRNEKRKYQGIDNETRRGETAQRLKSFLNKNNNKTRSSVNNNSYDSFESNSYQDSNLRLTNENKKEANINNIFEDV